MNMAICLGCEIRIRDTVNMDLAEGNGVGGS
jgi:hypothetical protein